MPSLSSPTFPPASYNATAEADAESLARLERAESDPHNPKVWPPLLSALSVGPHPAHVWDAVALMGRCGQDRIQGLEALGQWLGQNRRGDVLEFLALVPPTQSGTPYFTTVIHTLLARYRYLVDYDLGAACALYDRALTEFPFTDSFQGLSAPERDSLLRFLGHYTIPPPDQH